MCIVVSTVKTCVVMVTVYKCALTICNFYYSKKKCLLVLELLLRGAYIRNYMVTHFTDFLYDVLRGLSYVFVFIICSQRLNVGEIYL